MESSSSCPHQVALGALADLDPHPAYAEAAAVDTIAWDDAFGGWALFGHADCSRVLREVDTFVMPWAGAPGGELALGKYGIFNLTGDLHERVHKSLLDYFNPRKNRDLPGLVRRYVDNAFDAVADRPTFDFHYEVAERVPGLMAFGFLGLPEDPEVLDVVHTANGALQRFMQAYGGGEAEIAGLHEAHATLEPHFGPTIRARKRERRNDLISQLWTFAEGRDDWDEPEMIRQCLFYFGASFGNTGNALTNAAYLMVADPAMRHQLTGAPDQVPLFADETLRAWSSVQFRIRQATRDTEIAGQAVKAGDKLILVVGSANRDALVFTHPDRVDPERTSARRHLTFGVGPRYCVGATLARLEVQETLLALNRRFGHLEIDQHSPAPTFVGSNYRHFGPLVLRGTQRPR